MGLVLVGWLVRFWFKSAKHVLIQRLLLDVCNCSGVGFQIFLQICLMLFFQYCFANNFKNMKQNKKTTNEPANQHHYENTSAKWNEIKTQSPSQSLPLRSFRRSLKLRAADRQTHRQTTIIINVNNSGTKVKRRKNILKYETC